MKAHSLNFPNCLWNRKLAILMLLLPFVFISCKKESEEEKIPSWEGTLTLKVTSRQYCPGIVESTQVNVSIDKDDVVMIESGQISYSGASYTTNLGYTEQTGAVSFNPSGTFDRETGTLTIREHRITHDTVFGEDGSIALSFGNTEPWDALYLTPYNVNEASLVPVTILDASAMLTDLEWTLALTVSLIK